MITKHIFLTGHPGIGKTTIIVDIARKIQETLVTSKANKTINTNGNVQNNQRTIKLKGFYTTECRNSNGERTGFDIVYWPNDHHHGSHDNNDHNEHDGTGRNTNDENQDGLGNFVRTATLSRLKGSSTSSLSSSDNPKVGNYLVDVESVAKYAVPAIQPGKFGMKNRMNEDEKDKIVELVVLDEVGKMEMLCPTFVPAVENLLQYNDKHGGLSSNNVTVMVLGTIPTPRYGRIIPTVEDIRSRKDVLVLHVTKENRDELRMILSSFVLEELNRLSKLSDDDEEEDGDLRRMDVDISSLESYRYTRPIGAPSMHGNNTKKPTTQHRKQQRLLSKANHISNETNETSKKSNTNNGKDENDDNSNTAVSLDSNGMQHPHPRACGPLIDPVIAPRILLLGETASAQPNQMELAYAERSMWTILSLLFPTDNNNKNDKEVLPYTPFHRGEMESLSKLPLSVAKQDAPIETMLKIKQYQNLQTAVLGAGVAIWDVLSNVHVYSDSRHGRTTTRKRRNNNSSNTNPNGAVESDNHDRPNDIPDFIVNQYPSMEAIAFIGVKAKRTFCRLFHVDKDATCMTVSTTTPNTTASSLGKSKSIQLITLPSSSPSNSRMTRDEKALRWRESLCEFCPCLKS